MGSLRTIGQGLNFDSDKLNLGIGSSFIPNVRLSVYNNNSQSWRTAIFKNTPDSDYLSIGNYNCNVYLSAIANDNQTFKDLYINNLGISSQPPSNIGNIIMNGKVTIGNFSNNSNFNHSIDVFSQTCNIALFRNKDYSLSLSTSNSNITLDTNNNKISIIPNTYLNSNLYVSGFINGSNYLSNVVNNPSLYKIPANWVKIKANTAITTNSDNEIELNIDTSKLIIINGKLSTTETATATDVITKSASACNIYSTDFVVVGSNGYLPTLNEQLFIKGGVIIGSNSISPSLNFNKSNYSLLVSSNAFFNQNVNVNGIITGNGDNISNLNLKNMVNPSFSKFPATWLNIKPINPIKSSIDTNELFFDYDDKSPLYLTPTGKLSINITTISTISTAANFWNSNTPSEIYFRNADSFVGIGNTNPKSLLWIGDKGNLFRLTSPDSLNTSYYTQLSTNDNNSNNTNIRLITPTPFNYFNGADVSLSAGSIYYTIAGESPSHNFIYEKDGYKTNLMNIYNSGIVTIGSNINLPSTDKLKVYGNLSINNSNNQPCKLTIGDSINNNAILNTFGKIVIGNINAETNDYSFYVNNNAKFNNKVVIGNTITSFDGFPIITEYPLNVYGNIGITGNIFTTSDEKVKTNIKTIENSLDKICECRGVSFNYLNDSNKSQFGVIAQEIEKIIPDVVESNQYGYKNVNYLSIIGFLIEAVKELNNKITSNRI